MLEVILMVMHNCRTNTQKSARGINHTEHLMLSNTIGCCCAVASQPYCTFASIPQGEEVACRERGWRAQEGGGGLQGTVSQEGSICPVVIVLLVKFTLVVMHNCRPATQGGCTVSFNT
jgi:hypothetical protein